MSESKLMTWAMRVLAGSACCALAACHNAVQLPANLFPATAAGGWRLVVAREGISLIDDVAAALAACFSMAAPDPVPRNEIERLEEGLYEGPGKVDARVYALGSPTVGLELSQRWRPSSDTVFFNRGNFFVVVKWQAAERGALETFIRQLEGRLEPPDAAPRT